MVRIGAYGDLEPEISAVVYTAVKNIIALGAFRASTTSPQYQT